MKCLLFQESKWSNLFNQPVWYDFPWVSFPLSFDEQVAKDIQLIDSIVVRQAQNFSEEGKLFLAMCKFNLYIHCKKVSSPASTLFRSFCFYSVRISSFDTCSNKFWNMQHIFTFLFFIFLNGNIFFFTLAF